MSGRAWVFGFALTAMLALLPQRQAAAANAAEMNLYMQGPRYEGVLPRCDDPSALSKISARFNDTQASFWSFSWPNLISSSLSIKGYDQIRETAFRPWAGNTIPRRYCSAMVYISDGSKRPLHYSIGEDTGMIGMTWGVEWCVVGLDRNWAYNPVCRLAEP
jgi:hypothetical protein